MTWDERAIILIQELTVETGLMSGGVYIKYKHPKTNAKNRFWVNGDGTTMRWGTNREAHYEGWIVVTSPRFRAAILMALWPNWEPSNVLG